MNKNIILFKRINAKIGKSIFIVFALIKLRLFSNRKVKILFSNRQGWEQEIKNGFRFTQHKITFEELSPANIKIHDVVVPLLISDLKYLNETGHQVISNPIPIPSLKSIALCDDKFLFNQFMITNGFANCIPKMGDISEYPFILKKRVDEYGENSHIIFNSKQAAIFKDNIVNPEYFCQEIIPGSCEFATHIIFKGGKIVCSINIKYAFDKDIPIKGKDKAIYTKMCLCPYLEIFSSILATIEFEGLCCVNYKVVDNHPLVLEINPRFGRSLCPYFFSFMRYLV